MKNRIALIILLVLGITIVESCCDIEEVCFELNLTSISSFDIEKSTIANSNDTINIKNYSILLNSTTAEQLCMIKLELGTSLYGYDCDEPIHSLANRVENISITSNSQLSQDLPQGSELKMLFTPIEFNVSCINENNSNEDCIRDYSIFEGISTIEDVFNELFALNFYFSDQEIRDIDLLNLLLLNLENELIEEEHVFKISFEFSDGEIVELETNRTILKE